MNTERKNQKETESALKIFDRRTGSTEGDRRQRTRFNYLECRRHIERRKVCLLNYSNAWWLTVNYAECIDEQEFLAGTRSDSLQRFSE